jgi:S1-C subfamily serine protease
MKKKRTAASPADVHRSPMAAGPDGEAASATTSAERTQHRPWRRHARRRRVHALVAAAAVTLSVLSFGVLRQFEASAVTGGSLSSNDGVGRLDVNGLCSGVLIQPSLVMSAKHCGMTVGSTMTFFEYGAGGDKQPITAEISSDAIGHPTLDIAVARISLPPTGDLPTPIGLDFEPQPVGTEVTLIGYGITAEEDGPPGQQLQGVGTIRDVAVNSDGQDIYVADGIGSCQGDSGGALLNSSGRLVGILTHGTQRSKCSPGGISMITAGTEDFINNATSQLGVGA